MLRKGISASWIGFSIVAEVRITSNNNAFVATGAGACAYELRCLGVRMYGEERVNTGDSRMWVTLQSPSRCMPLTVHFFNSA